MSLLFNLDSLLLAQSLQVSLAVLQLGIEIAHLQDPILQFFDLCLGLALLLLLIFIVSSLHLRLLNKHLLFDFIDLLLLFNFELVHYPSVLFPELLDVVHQLFICLLLFTESRLKLIGFIGSLSESFLR